MYLDGYPGKPLEIVNRVGNGWLAVQVPTTASGALNLRIANGTGVSAQIRLNAARPHHLDTTRIAAGGPFRLFGRNLRVAGYTPTVTVNGLPATIDLSNSDEHLLSVTAPAALAAAAVATVVVDNGNGSGASTLDAARDRPASVVVAGSADPFALGVGWASAFTAIASRPIYPASDTRIADKAVCNGTHDDFGAIQQAIDLAAAKRRRHGAVAGRPLRVERHRDDALEGGDPRRRQGDDRALAHEDQLPAGRRSGRPGRVLRPHADERH